ncbi:Sel1 repeat protein [compost metagenome]
MYRSVSCFILFLAACSTENNPPGLRGVSGVPNNETFKLQFTCAHEKIPKARNEIEVIFLYARWLQKSNQLKRDAKIYAEVERLYRISAEQGHYKANINLQNGSMRGYFKLRGAEHLRLSAELIEVKAATGYLYVGYFLEQGSAGLRKDPEMALRYFRKAADNGNAQAQYALAEKLAHIDRAPDIARQMRRCAAEQGHGSAAVALSVNLRYRGEYREALEVLQMGAAAGDEHAAGYLDDGFRGPEPTNDLNYLGQQRDLERAERYNKIWRILSGYSYASPKVPEINDIVPLPPAKLPPWDGKLQWLEERLANIPPEKPSEALIQRLAKEKLLDPATGRPLPASPHFIKADNQPPLICTSGEACPQSGYWKLIGLAQSGWHYRGHQCTLTAPCPL